MAGSHSVSLKDGNGCITSQTISVGSPPALSLSLSKSDVSCVGATDGSVTATFSGRTGAVQLSMYGGGYAAATSPKTFSNLIAGSHSVSLKDGSGCTTSQRSEERRVGKECRSRWSPDH